MLPSLNGRLANHYNQCQKTAHGNHSPGVGGTVESLQKTMQKEKNLYRAGRGLEYKTFAIVRG